MSNKAESNKVKIQQLRADNPELKAVNIARMIGVTPEYVRQVLNELGLPTIVRKKTPKLTKVVVREAKLNCLLDFYFDGERHHTVVLNPASNANDVAAVLSGLAGRLRHDKLLK